MTHQLEKLTLKDIIDQKLISGRAIKICKDFGFENLSGIATYFLEYGSLLRIHKCGLKSQEELLNFCQDEIESLKIEYATKLNYTRNNTRLSDNDISLNEIKKRELLSVRTINVCEYSRLYSLELIIKYYLANASFLRLRNCGPKSNEELISFCEKYGSMANKKLEVAPLP